MDCGGSSLSPRKKRWSLSPGPKRHPLVSKRFRFPGSGVRRSLQSQHALSRITHNALGGMGALGQGLRQFFQPQRHCLPRPAPTECSCGSSPFPFLPLCEDPKCELLDQTLDPEIDLRFGPAPSAAAVLGCGSGPPTGMRRGTSLQSRRAKVGGTTVDLPLKGSPLILRHAAHDAVLQAERSRSSSTSDTPNSPALVHTSPGCQSPEEAEQVRYKCKC